MLKLHEEILEFSSFMQQTDDERRSSAAALRRLQDVCHQVAPGKDLAVFGSRSCGLALPGADWDVTLLGIHSHESTMMHLSRALKATGDYSYVKPIPRARIPIIKMTDLATGLELDVSFAAESGPRSSAFVAGLLRQLPEVRPLVLVLKCFLKQRDINETFSGGVGSFLLFCMVAHHVAMSRATLARRLAGLGGSDDPRAAQKRERQGRRALFRDQQSHDDDDDNDDGNDAGNEEQTGEAEAGEDTLALAGPSMNLGMLLLSFFETFGMRHNSSIAGFAFGRLHVPDWRQVLPTFDSLAAGEAFELPGARSKAPSAGKRRDGKPAAALPVLVGAPKVYNKRARRRLDGSNPFALSLESPVDPDLDIGKNAFKYWLVRNAFRAAYSRLVRAAAAFRISYGRGRETGGKGRGRIGTRPEAAGLAEPRPVSMLSTILAVDDPVIRGRMVAHSDELEDLLAGHHAKAARASAAAGAGESQRGSGHHAKSARSSAAAGTAESQLVDLVEDEPVTGVVDLMGSQSSGSILSGGESEVEEVGSVSGSGSDKDDVACRSLAAKRRRTDGARQEGPTAAKANGAGSKAAAAAGASASRTARDGGAAAPQAATPATTPAAQQSLSPSPTAADHASGAAQAAGPEGDDGFGLVSAPELARRRHLQDAALQGVKRQLRKPRLLASILSGQHDRDPVDLAALGRWF